MNGLCLRWELLTLQLRNPFRLSYGVSETRQAYWLRLADDAGWGEGTIPPYYRVDPTAMTQCWERASKQTLPFPNDIADIPHWLPEGPAGEIGAGIGAGGSNREESRPAVVSASRSAQAAEPDH